MSVYEEIREDKVLKRFGKDIFTPTLAAYGSKPMLQVICTFAVGVAAIIIAALLTIQPISVTEPASAESFALSKSDRISTPHPAQCDGQAWGAWSAECAAALRGEGNVRNIRFITVSEPTAAHNTTVLSRVVNNS